MNLKELELDEKRAVGKYPCEPIPFQTMMGVVMICKKCGHYAPPECR